MEVKVVLVCVVLLLLTIQTLARKKGPIKQVRQSASKKKSPLKENVCKLPKVIGPCSAALTRYYFNSRSKKCYRFTYGGCYGNANNFRSKASCVQACVCYLPKKTGRCRARFQRYFFNAKTGKCGKFIYGGCGGNANNFRSLRLCSKVCKRKPPAVNKCLQKPEKGKCRARLPRYYYNPSCKCCRKFYYGGCGGNANNFKTILECIARCPERKHYRGNRI